MSLEKEIAAALCIFLVLLWVCVEPMSFLLFVSLMIVALGLAWMTDNVPAMIARLSDMPPVNWAEVWPLVVIAVLFVVLMIVSQKFRNAISVMVFLLLKQVNEFFDVVKVD